MKKFKSVFIVIGVLIAVFLVAQITGLRLCAVQSSSMEPNIPTYSICLVTTHIQYDEVEIGDVVVYTRVDDNNKIIHRVIEITDEGLITKGDANQSDDGISVTEDNLYALSLLHIPYLGKLFNLVRSPIGIAIIATLFGLLVIMDKKDDSQKKEPVNSD